MGIGSSEWQQAAYGLNQTDRPGAVWLKAFTAAMDEKKRPIFCDLQPRPRGRRPADLPPYVAERLLRFARCAAAVARDARQELPVGRHRVSMGIIGSDVRRNLMLALPRHGHRVRTTWSASRGRIDKGLLRPRGTREGASSS